MVTRTDDVVRQDLLRRLPAADGDDRLLIVAAPGGWGKTTMLGTWDEWAAGTAFCRFGISTSDNDPTRFINGLLASAGPVLGERPRGWPDPGESTPMVWAEDTLPEFLEAIQADAPVALVLDDYHLVDNPETHAIVQSLVESAGSDTLTVLSTRVDPPLKLARLRAARVVSEVRAEDLEFSTEDADLLLRQSFGLELDRDHVRLLVERTEGWPAAISLAAQSLRTVNDPGEFLTRFVATDRLIVDYLAEELLDALPSSHREFLHHTSVVEQFVPDLSATLSPRDDAGQIGEDLERRGLLRRSYEADRLWYRYHQLLRDVLYQRLDASVRGEKHIVAADWFLADGQPRAAIEQLIAAGETGRAIDLIVEHAQPYVGRGRYDTVENWITDVADTPEAGPSLFLIGAQAALYGGRVDRARTWLARALAAEGDLEPGDRLFAFAIELTLAHAAGRSDDATEIAEQLIEHHEIHDPIDADPGIVGEALFVAAMAFAVVDQSDRSDRYLDRCIAACAPSSNQIPAVAGYGVKALLRYLAGDEHVASSLTERAAEIGADMNLPPSSIHMTPIHMIRVLRGCEGEGRQSLDELRRISEFIYSPYAVAISHLCEASFQLAVGQIEAAKRAVVVSRDLIDEFEQPAAMIERYHQLIAGRVPGSVPVDEPAGPQALTDRELQVLRAFSSNLTQREIGRELFLSFNTIKTYARSAYRKLGVSSRSEAVRACRAAGLF